MSDSYFAFGVCPLSPGVTGNQGLKDQATVLQWIQDNIEDYGGDKQNVTLWGEISGAAHVVLHLLSSGSKFSRLILQVAVVFKLSKQKNLSIGCDFLLHRTTLSFSSDRAAWI